MLLRYTTTRARTHRGRPDPSAPAAGAIYRLHREDCRFAGGPSSMPITFAAWQALNRVAAATATTDDYLLCRACRPDEADA